jgi:hypothetical protein
MILPTYYLYNIEALYEDLVLLLKKQQLNINYKYMYNRLCKVDKLPVAAVYINPLVNV